MANTAGSEVRLLMAAKVRQTALRPHLSWATDKRCDAIHHPLRFMRSSMRLRTHGKHHVLQRFDALHVWSGGARTNASWHVDAKWCAPAHTTHTIGGTRCKAASQ
jgi:hypothetical protein